MQDVCSSPLFHAAIRTIHHCSMSDQSAVCDRRPGVSPPAISPLHPKPPPSPPLTSTARTSAGCCACCDAASREGANPRDVISPSSWPLMPSIMDMVAGDRKWEAQYPRSRPACMWGQRSQWASVGWRHTTTKVCLAG